MTDERNLRDIVSQEFRVFENNDASDEDCRESCKIIFKAMGVLLANDTIFSFPLDFLRATVSRILREIGPGDTLFRTSWLGILRRCNSIMGLQFALEFLPSALLPLQGKETDATIQQVLRLLESTAERNRDAMTPIFDCIHRLAAINRITQRDAFQFCIHHLNAPENDVAILCLLDHATEEDWPQAVEAIRSIALSDKLEDGLPYTCSAISVLHNRLRGGNDAPFFNEYLASVEDSFSDANPIKLSTLDLVILLLHRDHSEDGSSVESAFEEMVSSGAICFQSLSSLSQLITSSEKDHFDHLVWLMIFLCVTPLRSPSLVEVALPLAKDFGIDLVLKSDLDEKERIVSALLQCYEDCLECCNETSKDVEEPPGKTKSSTIPGALSVMYEILFAVAKETPEALLEHNLSIIRSLRTDGLERETVQYICKLVVLVSNHTKVKDIKDEFLYFDPTLVVRELLFSNDCDGVGRSDLCVRGLMLICEMMAFGHLKPAEVSLLWESVRQVLLPPTNRLVDPRIGIEGLRALRIFHSWSETTTMNAAIVLSPGIFPTMTSILMNTRLVKYSASLDRSKVGITLGYSNRPVCFNVGGSKQRKFHKMIFSFSALLIDRDFSSPSRWELSNRWTFDLIDTYLTLGRTKSKGKWIPHAWVEAAFEFSSTHISSLRAINARQQRTMDVVEGVLNDFDACTESVTSKASSHRDFVGVLKQMKKKSERTRIAQSLLRCALSHSLGLAMTGAILWNTHAHYNAVLTIEDDETGQQQRLEAIRLMQYQLAKIYDLVGKCQIMEAVFRGITSTNPRARGRQKKSNRADAIGAGLQFESKVGWI